MAPVKCGKCGSEEAPNARACSRCGAQVSKPGLSTKQILLIVFGGLGMCCFGTCALGAIGAATGKPGGNRPAAASAPSAEATARWVDMTTLLSEYRDNEVRADSNFKGQFVQTAGVVDDVKKDLFGSIYVTLGTGRQFEIPQVQCFFDESQSKKAATLTKGSRVTVHGRVEGLMMNVLMRRCEFIGL
ncbi:hypothetical protein JKA73_37450 [Myxococcus xanthus]|uniref:OB-fold protein n=1 Tax=Myxococcus xanthus TaxID=34 RepID=UPI0019178EA4|nr:hypothetical protein [Myxococcus xanthus]QQR44572.1 hypothetical protein JKA73_37450 [Myxococcus xanthus]